MHFLPEAEKRKINGAYAKGQENERLQGVSDLGAFKLDHLQTVKLILFQKSSVFLIFILGSPIPYYPRERG